MLQTITTYFQYIVTCANCQNCWATSKQELADLDTATCSDCGGCRLNIQKYFEV